jgi:hypothetical protein
MKAAHHLCETGERYSPPELIELARAMLGGWIDLDPCSTAQANVLVQAGNYFSQSLDALDPDTVWQSWGGNRIKTAWINPPGGKVGNRSQAALFLQRAVTEYNQGNLERFAFCLFNLSVLQVMQSYVTLPSSTRLVILSKRIPYINPVTMAPMESPPHPSGLLYVGDTPTDALRTHIANSSLDGLIFELG